MFAKYLVSAGILSGSLLVGSAQCFALPFGVANPPAVSAPIETVRFGCGLGWHPNRWGRCVRNRVVVMPPPVVIYRPGWHYYHWNRWHHWHHGADTDLPRAR